MSSKRKSDGPTKKTVKRNKKKDEDYGSDMSDSDGISDGGGSAPDEILISGENDDFEAPKLPEDLLATYDKDCGNLLISGQVTWELVARRDNGKPKMAKIRPNLYTFHRFTDEKYRLIASGPAAAHSIVVNMDRKALSFGRNQYGQLGHAKLEITEKPTPVDGLENVNIIQAACGRNHSLFLSDTGTVYACGDNRNGQCGVGNNTATITKATRIKFTGGPIIKIGAGAEFSAILDIKGNLHTFGLTEFGQLGHNTDGKYFQTSTKMAFHNEMAPKRVVLYIEKAKDGHVVPCEGVQIVDFSCGNNHTVAIDSKKRAFSWGFGGYGRLGHAEPKDEMVPRLIKQFDASGRGVRSIYCGATYSLAITDIGQLYLFGQTKKTGEANMYPKPVQDLAGWNIIGIGTGNTSIVISADDSLIAWGASPTYGELGLGELQKSTTTPREVVKMDGMKIPQVTMGFSHTLLLANTENELTDEIVKKLPVFTVDD